MKKIISLIIILTSMLAGNNLYYAQTPAELYNEANRKYRNEEYLAAESLYHQVLENGVYHPHVFYNLGNAYFKAGSLAKAILNYERAHFLTPRDKEINKNLNYAHLMTKDKIKSIYDSGVFLRTYKKVLSFLALREYYYLFIILTSLLTLLIIIYILFREKYFAKAILNITVIIFLISIISVTLYVLKTQNIWETNAAIVMSAKADVMSAPYEDGEILFSIHAGTKVGIVETRGEWHKVNLLDGREGWMRDTILEKIWPPPC